ncbi:MAG: hypothetical protein EHM39_10170 [Chloroflexi bacterium]|nr:MAG: hypothetical protein EHM39_10170 [Chloroflexota bacterium]
MNELPDYISDRGHGEISYSVPLQINDVTCYSFVLSADVRQLQDFIDSQLNVVSGGAVTYTALPFLFHSYLEALHCTSTSETIGYLPDRESAFLVPLLQRTRGEMPSLKIWVPYLLIDQMSGMVTGREVWGYRKSIGSISLPANSHDPARFSAKTMLFKKFSNQTLGKIGTLLQVRSKSSIGEFTSIWDGFEHAFKEIIERTLGKIGGELAELPEEVLASFLGKSHMPVINLKQFRDAVDSTKACYQALVESPCQLDKWTGGGLLSGEFEIEITTCDSHQIVSDLGLGQLGSGDSTVIQPLFGWWIQLNFSTLAGSIIWTAR